jgi:ribose transport system permease protein
LFILAVLMAVMTALSPFFFTFVNLQNLLVQTSIIATVALGQLLVIITRGVDISVGAVVALSAVLGATLAHTAGTPGSALLFFAGILLAGAAIGTLNGGFIVWGKIPQPLIVTLASLGIARGLALIISGGQPIVDLPPVVSTIGNAFVGPLPVPVLLVLLLAAGLYVLTSRTQYGRWIYAVGGNPEAAQRVGIPVGRVVFSVYLICSLTAAFAGLLTAGRTATATPLAGDLLELDAITAVIIGGASFFGGRGSVVNVLIGALILGTVRNGLDLLSVSPFYQNVAVGLIILLALELDVIRGWFEEKLRVAQAGRA